MTSENTKLTDAGGKELRAGQTITVTLELRGANYRQRRPSSHKPGDLVAIPVGAGVDHPATIGVIGLRGLLARDPSAVEVVADPEPDWLPGDFGVTATGEVFRYLPRENSARPWWSCNRTTGSSTSEVPRTAEEMRGKLRRHFLAGEDSTYVWESHTHWCAPIGAELHSYPCINSVCASMAGEGKACPSHLESAGR